MTVDEIMNLEIDGLNNTIRTYCKDNYVLSYTDKLKTLDFPKDQVYIKKLALRLLNWYEEVLPSIEESKFITNKKEHIKSIELLEDLVNQIST
jgi:hypothetical protein